MISQSSLSQDGILWKLRFTNWQYIPLIYHLYIANWMIICNLPYHLLREPETAIDLMRKKYSWIGFAKTLVQQTSTRRLKRNEPSWWWPDYRLFHDFIASVGQLHIYNLHLSPTGFALQNVWPWGHYKVVFAYYFIRKKDPGHSFL